MISTRHFSAGLFALLTLMTILSAGCSPSQTSAADEPLDEHALVEQKADFKIKPGMTLDTVKEALGEPTHEDRAKSGNPVYIFEFGTYVRSIEVGPEGRVIVAYP